MLESHFKNDMSHLTKFTLRHLTFMTSIQEQSLNNIYIFNTYV